MISMKHMRAGERRKFARNMQYQITSRQIGFAGFGLLNLVAPILVLFGIVSVGYAAVSHSHTGALIAAAAPFVAPKNIVALRQQLKDVTEEGLAIVNEGMKSGSFTDDQRKKLAELKAKKAGFEQDIELTMTFLEGEKHPEAKVVSTVQTDSKGKKVYARLSEQMVANGLKPSSAAESLPPFASLAEQLHAVYKTEISQGRNIDARLTEINAAAQGSNEAVPAEGGFLIFPEFSQTLLEKTYEVGQLASRCANMDMTSNRMIINAVDEDARTDGSRWGGILAYWVSEAGTYTGTKPKFRQLQLVANKLIGLLYATEEQLEDGTALQSYVERTFPKEFAFKIDDAIYNGSGAGQPLGFLNSGALYAVAAEGGQTTKTIVTNNILKMWQHLFATSRRTAVWLINQDTEAQLYPLTLGSPSLAQILMYMPPGVNGNPGPYGLLMGRPVIPVEQAATLGTQGDIVLADFDQYLLAKKGEMRADTSIHVAFLTGEQAFRFMVRVDGQPTWKKPLTPKNGSNLLSPFIALASR